MKYNPPEFFTNYVKDSRSSGRRNPHPDPWLKEHVVDNLPDYVTTVVEFGCALGRNLTPFANSGYKCIGFDLFEPADIQREACCDFLYAACSLEDFLKNPNHPVFAQIEWEKCLVMTHGTLMYFKEKTGVNNFIKDLKTKGCRNFSFYEYSSIAAQHGLSERALNGGLGYIDLDKENLKLFTPPLGKKISMGEEPQYELMAHIHLEST